MENHRTMFCGFARYARNGRRWFCVGPVSWRALTRESQQIGASVSKFIHTERTLSVAVMDLAGAASVCHTYDVVPKLKRARARTSTGGASQRSPDKSIVTIVIIAGRVRSCVFDGGAGATQRKLLIVSSFRSLAKVRCRLSLERASASSYCEFISANSAATRHNIMCHRAGAHKYERSRG